MSKSVSASTMFAKDATARSGLYKLFARLWLQEVDHELLEELLSPSFSNTFLDAGGTLPSENTQQEVEKLAIDYCQLFIGPKNHLPPIQSVWQSGQLQSSTTVSMKEFVDIVGYEIEELPSGTIIDHFGVQLDVMSHILEQISLADFETEELRVAIEIAHSFFAKHLVWSSHLLQAAEQKATTEFYLAVIQLTRRFTHSETNLLKNRLPA